MRVTLNDRPSAEMVVAPELMVATEPVVESSGHSHVSGAPTGAAQQTATTAQGA